MPKTNNSCRVAVIGAGASGLLFAGMAGELAGADCEITVFEKNRQPGRKLAITGKGRCNVTNDCAPDEVLRHTVSNPRFLYSAVSSFPPSEVMALFERLGVPLVTERGRRVFPVSNRAYDIVDALAAYAARGARGGMRFLSPVTSVAQRADGGFTVRCDKKSEDFDFVVLATGGISYPGTGSTGDGYRFARGAGHTVTPLAPSIVPIEAACRALCAEMMGLSLRNVALKILREDGSSVYEDFGEMLFTHFGVSGPMILSASAHMKSENVAGLTAVIDLKPALDRETLDARLVSELSENANRDFTNVLSSLLPQKMQAPFARLCGIAPHRKANSVTRAERQRVLDMLKAFPVRLSALRPPEEAVITSGGVSVREIDPKTMMSRLVPGMYFIGELPDCDAVTGGYNLQIAFSTAAAAARDVARRAADSEKI